MINGLISVIVIFLILTLGFIFSWRNLWPQNTTTVLSVIVVKIAAPVLALTSIADHFTPDLIRSSSYYLLAVVLHLALLFSSGKILSRVLRLPSGKKNVFEVNFTFSNVIFIGLPINQIVFGSEALPYLFIYYLVTLTAFWSLGAYQLEKASTQTSGKGFSPKKIINPGLIGVLAGCLLVEMQLTLPSALDSAIRYLSGLCVPLSLLVIGANLVVFSKGFPKFHLDEYLILCAKFIISPLIMFSLLQLFHIEGMAFKVFMLTAAMPCHMQTSILAEFYGVEGAYASKIVSLSTLASLFTIPFFAMLLSN